VGKNAFLALLEGPVAAQALAVDRGLGRLRMHLLLAIFINPPIRRSPMTEAEMLSLARFGVDVAGASFGAKEKRYWSAVREFCRANGLIELLRVLERLEDDHLRLLNKAHPDPRKRRNAG
jgi:hypothetical protein